MGDSKTDKEALDELKAASTNFVEPALAAYKQVKPELETVAARFVAAVQEGDAQVIAFQQRNLTGFMERLGKVLTTIDAGLDAMQGFAGDPKLAAAHEPALKAIRGLSAARNQLGSWLAKAKKLQAKAVKVMQASAGRSGNVEVQWAKVQSQLAEGSKALYTAMSELMDVVTQARSAAQQRDGDKLDALQRKAEQIMGTSAVQFGVDEAKRHLKEFESDLKAASPSADFTAQFKRDKAKMLTEIAEMEGARDQMGRDQGSIIVLKAEFNVREIARRTGIPVAEASLMGPAFSKGDSAALKALDKAAKKHGLEASPKDMLASLQKLGLLPRA